MATKRDVERAGLEADLEEARTRKAKAFWERIWAPLSTLPRPVWMLLATAAPLLALIG